VKEILKSVNIWKSYKEERRCLMHFARLANTLIKDEKVHETITANVPRNLRKLKKNN